VPTVKSASIILLFDNDNDSNNNINNNNNKVLIIYSAFQHSFTLDTSCLLRPQMSKSRINFSTFLFLNVVFSPRMFIPRAINNNNNNNINNNINNS